MKSLLYALTALAVFGLAFWAYRENYATQQVLKETRGLQREIGAAQELYKCLGVLRSGRGLALVEHHRLLLDEERITRGGLSPPALSFLWLRAPSATLLHRDLRHLGHKLPK